MFSFNNKLALNHNGQAKTKRRELAKTIAAVVFTLALCIAVITLPKSSPSRRILTTITNNNNGQVSNHAPHHLPSMANTCMTPELVGEWAPVDRSIPGNQFNAPHCCPSLKDSDDLHLITDESREFCEIPTLIRPGGHACRCVPGTARHETLDNSLSWFSPYIPKWDATKSCQLLNNRRVLILGDSTLNQAAGVLSAAFHEGGCGQTMQFLYSDTLVGRNMGAMNRGKHWLAMVKEQHFPDIVIIGGGAHIHSEANFTRTANELADQIVFMRHAHPEVTVIWKTSSPAGCTDTPSMQHPLDAGKMFEFGSKDWAYWAQFYDRDTIMINKMVNLGVPILDNRMLYARSDAHLGSYDCMHFCLPGPLDILPPLLQMLLERDFEPSKCVTIHQS